MPLYDARGALWQPDWSSVCCGPWEKQPRNITWEREIYPVRVRERKAHLESPLGLPVPQSNTVVTALVWSYPLEVFRIFVLSLRAHYEGDIVLLIYSKPPDDIVQFMEAQRVTPMPIVAPPDFSVRRFQDYARVCRHGTYKLCLVADFKDVFFQANPFAGVPKPYPGLLLPEESKKIGQCIFNSAWMLKGYGPATKKTLADKAVICSGLIIGTPKGFLELSKRIVQYRASQDMTRIEQGIRGQQLWGSGWDQAAVEYMAHTGKLDDLNVLMQPRGRGIVNTVGTLLSQDVIRWQDFLKPPWMDAEGMVLNDDGTPSAVVHQYDRIFKRTGNVLFGALRFSRTADGTRQRCTFTRNGYDLQKYNSTPCV